MQADQHARRAAHPIEPHAGRAADARRGLLPCVMHHELASCAAGATASLPPLAAQHPTRKHTPLPPHARSYLEHVRLPLASTSKQVGGLSVTPRHAARAQTREAAEWYPKHPHSPTCLREPRTRRLDLLYFVGLCGIAVPPPVRQALHHRAPCRLLQRLLATREQGGSLFILLKGFVDRVGSSCSRTHGTLMLLFDREPCKQ